MLISGENCKTNKEAVEIFNRRHLNKKINHNLVGEIVRTFKSTRYTVYFFNKNFHSTKNSIFLFQLPNLHKVLNLLVYIILFCLYYLEYKYKTNHREVNMY